jgi:poly-gamma-glutamate capsule biosynthesis protein CapA/YwtB (metallophosphatase superfamily)
MPLYDSESRNLRLALCGDMMLTRRLAVYKEPRFLGLRELLTSTDCTFANFETTCHQYGEGYPSVTHGTYMTTEPHLLDDVKWFGINLVATANNHAYEYTDGGILSTFKNLDAAGIIHAGTGANLRQAVSPGYIDTPAGRIALIAAVATFEEFNRATDQRPDAIGKPGVNALGHQTVYEIDEQAMKELRRVGEGIGLEAEKARNRGWFYSASEAGGAEEGTYTFFGKRFRQSSGFAVRTTVNKRDAEAQLQQIREARREADWIVVSLHSHEMGGESFLKGMRRPDLIEPADFVKDFAHACIDEGADVFVGHGPHSLLGAEVYKGKPILYSLGDFVMENETVRHFPSYAYGRFGLDHYATPADFLDARTDKDTKAHPAHSEYWESVIAVCDFQDGQLQKVELHPIDLGFKRPRSQRGRPLLADSTVGEKILSDMDRLSKPWGTRIARNAGVGVIAGK